MPTEVTVPEATATAPAPALDDAHTVLVVDDSPVERCFASAGVEHAGYTAVPAGDGREALEILKRRKPALILTDLIMPHVDGLELVDRVRRLYPEIPVVLMTANGSQEVALEALRTGAAGYVPKSVLAEQLPAVLESVLSSARADRRKRRFLEGLTRLEFELSLENDEAIIPVLVAHFQEHLVSLGLCDQAGRIRVGVALEEAVLNGMHHGNLELSSELKEVSDAAYREEAAARKLLPHYAGRRLHVGVRMTADEARFVLRDEGPGFDVTRVPDPTDPANLVKPSGRGLMLIRAFMAEAYHNETGNQLPLVWRPQGERRL